MKKTLFLTGCLIATFGAIAQTTVTIRPNALCGKDALIGDYNYSGVNYLNRNFGCHPDFIVTAWTAGGYPTNLRALIEFDLSPIPTNVTVTSAKLYFYAHNSFNNQSNGAGNVLVQKITQAWDEFALTWNNQPTTTPAMSISPVNNGQDIEIDITSLAQGWVSNPNTNHGLLFRQEYESYYRGMNFASSDDANSNKHPKLVITLSSNITVNIPDCNPQPVITASGPLSLCSGSSVTLTSSSATGNLWSTGATTQSITVSSAGSYWVKVSQACGSPYTSEIVTVTVGDQQNPVARCKNYTLNLADGNGTVSVSDINNGSSDNCSIALMSVSPSSFNCNEVGTKTVTLTVTDGSGNTGTCESTVTVNGIIPTCSISVTPENNTYTGGIATNLYLGYGPQSATITANASGGSDFTYSWSPSTALSCSTCQSPVFTPTSEGNYTYTVTVTNSNGCTTACEKSFCVKDIRVSGQNKVYLCHGSQTLSVSVNAIPSHLANHSGDRLGNCNNTCTQNKRSFANDKSEEEEHLFESLEVKCIPNPFTNSFKLTYYSNSDMEANILIYGITGNLVQKVSLSGYTNEVELGKNIPAGMYTVTVIQSDKTRVLKVIKVN